MENRPSAKAIVGLAYCVLGAACFVAYFLVLLPLIDCRMQFSRQAARQEIIVFGRSLAEKVEEKEKSVLESLAPLIARLGITVDSGFFRSAAHYQTDFDKLEERARVLFERDRLTQSERWTLPTGDSSAKTSGFPSVVPDQIVEPVPSPYLFVAWLENENYALFDSWLARQLVALRTSGLAIRTYMAFSLAAGLFFGGLRLLVTAHRTTASSEAPATSVSKLFLLPWATPVMSLLILVLLSGFGPVLAGPLDPATRRLLVIISLAIGIAPEVFVSSLRTYVAEAARQFIPSDISSQS